MKVINCTKEQLTLEIVLANGTADSINLQPLSRADLPAGATLNPTKRPLYERRRMIKVVDDPAPAPSEDPVQTLLESEVTPSTTDTETSSSGSISVSDNTAGK